MLRADRQATRTHPAHADGVNGPRHPKEPVLQRADDAVGLHSGRRPIGR
jgi:hypothetical protein